MIKQVEILAKRVDIKWVKIGLIESYDVLNKLLDYLLKKFNNIKIIWDPILKATSGHEFHSKIDRKKLENICKKILLITPNKEEMSKLISEMDVKEGSSYLSKYCDVFLKNVHEKEDFAKDILFQNGHEYYFIAERIKKTSKHGSGCVLSSAILANLAKGNDIKTACSIAKEYTLQFLKSSPNLLGHHIGVL